MKYGKINEVNCKKGEEVQEGSEYSGILSDK